METYISVKQLKKSKKQCIELIKYKDGLLAVKKNAYTESYKKLLQHENEIYQFVSGSESIIPKILKTDGINYFIEEYYEGMELSELYNNENVDNYIEKIVDAVEILHSINIDSLRILHPEYDNWKEYLKLNVNMFSNRVKNFDDLVFEEIKPVIEYVYNTILKMNYSDQKSVLVHNDLNPGNIMILSDSKVRFLDFERWIIGDPLKDISKMVWMFRKNSYFGHKVYRSFVQRGIIEDDLEKLKMYFLYDILFHFSLFDELRNEAGWAYFFHEEMEIIKNFDKLILW